MWSREPKQPILQQIKPHITKTLASMSIRYQSDANILFDIDPKILATWGDKQHGLSVFYVNTLAPKLYFRLTFKSICGVCFAHIIHMSSENNEPSIPLSVKLCHNNCSNTKFVSLNAIG